MKIVTRRGLGFRSRPQTYSALAGVVTAMVGVGLLLPFVFGTPLATTGRTGGPLLSGNPDTTSSTVRGATSPSDIAAGAAAGAGGLANGPGRAGPKATLNARQAAAAGLTASDRGVTPTSITIAFTLSDLGSLSKVGFGVRGFDTASQKQYITTFVDDVNNHGGVNGRKILPVFVTYDPTDQSSSQTACLTATQENAIFAAVDSGGGLNEPGTLCFTQQNHTPLLNVGSFGTPAYLYRDSGGYLFTVDPAGARSLANTAFVLHNAGLLKGKRIGVLDRDFPGSLGTINDGLVAVLKSLGYNVVHREDLSSNDETATSQVPVAVQQMQANTVDAIFLLPDFIIGSEFVQSADKAAYHPLYFATDFESETNDPAVMAMPSSYQAVGVTVNRTGEWRQNLPEPAIDASCRQRYAAATGTNPARSDNTYAAVGLACGVVDAVARGARAAGPQPTRAKYAAALQQLGSFPFPYTGSFSFKAGKFDGADAVRTIEFDSSCTCWMPRGPFAEPRF